MNPKTVVCIVLMIALTSAVCSARRSSNKALPFRQLLRELSKNEDSRIPEETPFMKSKRDVVCDYIDHSCTDTTVRDACTNPANTCEGIEVECYPDQDGDCVLSSSNSYRR